LKCVIGHIDGGKERPNDHTCACEKKTCINSSSCAIEEPIQTSIIYSSHLQLLVRSIHDFHDSHKYPHVVARVPFLTAGAPTWPDAVQRISRLCNDIFAYRLVAPSPRIHSDPHLLYHEGIGYSLLCKSPFVNK